MEAQEVLQNAMKKLAARTHGQVRDVRTIMGRQLQFLNQNSEIFLLPYFESIDLQDPDTGEMYYMLDVDPLDSAPIQ